MDLENHPKIIDIERRLQAREAFEVYCKNTHTTHNSRNESHSLAAAQHLELINGIIASQSSLNSSVSSLAESFKSMSKFIKDNEKAIEMIVSVIKGFAGLKRLILGTAAIVVALGIILGAVVTTWSIINAPSVIDALIMLRNLQ